MKNNNWMKHYSSMDYENPMEESISFKMQKISGSSLSKKDIKSLLATREIIRQHAIETEKHRRAIDIKEVDQSKYIVKINSIEYFLLKALYDKKAPTHINDIIESIESIGWKSKSKYHKYNQVSKALRSNYFMFRKAGRALFSLREGFGGRNPEKTLHLNIQETSQSLTTIKDIVVDVVKRYGSEYEMFPARVLNIMSQIGYNCAYSTVRRAMQNNLIRNGKTYTLKK